MNKNNSDIVSESNTDGQVPTSTNLMIQAQLDMLTKNMTAITPVVNLMSQFIQDNMTGEHIGQYDSEKKKQKLLSCKKRKGRLLRIPLKQSQMEIHRCHSLRLVQPLNCWTSCPKI